MMQQAELARGFYVLRAYTDSINYVQFETVRDVDEAWSQAIQLLVADTTLQCVRLFGLLPGGNEIKGFIATIPDAYPYYVDFREKFSDVCVTERFVTNRAAKKRYFELLNQNFLVSTNV